MIENECKCEIVNDEEKFPTKTTMEDLIDIMIIEVVLQKYGKIWRKGYCSNEVVHVFHRVGHIEIDDSYLREIQRNVKTKVIKYQNEGKAFNLRRIVKRTIKYLES